MKVDIWSDIRCPFCYIGKRKFESALSQFAHKDQVQIVWRSFELDPNLQTQPDMNVNDYLAERKGISRERAAQMHNQLTQSANEVGLTYNFDKAVVANSLNAHRLVQLAKKQGLGDIAKERIFKAYFTEGKNIDDAVILIQLGKEIGLNAVEVEQMLASDSFTEDVRKDEAMANTIGINGVPFFLMNEKYAISGAQSQQTFLKGLEKAWSEYESVRGNR